MKYLPNLYAARVKNDFRSIKYGNINNQLTIKDALKAMVMQALGLLYHEYDLF